jgi:hypothetical protein
MALGVDDVPAGRVVWKTALLSLGTFGFVFFLTLLYLSMRAVMDVGGACAEGGPFEIRQQCPEGVAWMVPVSIFGMIASVGIGFLGVFRQGGPRPYVFAWSALFLALGWNFLEYGFDPPGGGTSAGWLVCGFVFVAMGGAPLLVLLSRSAARWVFWGPRDGTPGPVWTPPRTELLVEPDGDRVTRTRVEDEPRDPPASGDVVERLERLAALHDRGAIDDTEYETAKDAVLHEERAP